MTLARPGESPAVTLARLEKLPGPELVRLERTPEYQALYDAVRRERDKALRESRR